MVLDLSLPDMDGLSLLRSLDGEHPSVIVYTARSLSKSETRSLEEYAQAVVLKEGPSLDRVLDEIKLFTRKVSPARDTRAKHTARAVDPVLRGKTTLLVDDDMRTVYALSAILRARGIEVRVADTGLAALASLDAHPDIDAVLMDVMMPEMDGYEAMQRIRSDARFARLPIISLTAKAMKGDEEKCLAAGADAYLPKPVDVDRLFELLGSLVARSPADA
jgi:CheY-like chemotaxis protein